MPLREGPLGVLGRIASTFAGGPPDGARNAWQGFAPWLQRLTLAAGTRWMPYLVRGIPCEVAEQGHACANSAIGACGICHKPSCLDHAFVAQDGSSVCYVCVGKAAAAAGPKIPGAKPPPGPGHAPPPGAQPPPGPNGNGGTPPRAKNQPPPEAYVAARRVLGVKRSASPADVERAYRKLLARWHPDKHPPHLRDDAEKRFKEVRTAYDFLKDHPQ